MIKILLLSLLLVGCTGAKTSNGLVASTETTETIVENAKKIEINNDEIPEWALGVMGTGVILFALIIPSPFKFKGFR